MTSKCETCYFKGHSVCPYQDTVIPEDIQKKGCFDYVKQPVRFDSAEPKGQSEKVKGGQKK